MDICIQIHINTSRIQTTIAFSSWRGESLSIVILFQYKIEILNQILKTNDLRKNYKNLTQLSVDIICVSLEFTYNFN